MPAHDGRARTSSAAQLEGEPPRSDELPKCHSPPPAAIGL